MKLIKCILYCVTGLLIVSCVKKSNVDPLAELTKNQAQQQVQSSDIKLSDEEFYALVQSIPSPLQATSLMQEVGVEYQSSLLHSTDNASSYANWFAQATNMGVYGADMAYANVYDKTTKSMDYVGSVRELADKLKVGQFFDLATFRELSSKSDDINALINETQMNFQKMNDYLQKQNRGKVSVAMVLGGWVEGLYLSSTVALQNPDNEVLRELVAEQKLSVESISMLISLYSSDENYQSFEKSFSQLISAFDEIKMIYHEGEIKQYEDENGNLVAEDSSSTEIVVTKESVAKIQKITKEIRNQLINSK